MTRQERNYYVRLAIQYRDFPLLRTEIIESVLSDLKNDWVKLVESTLTRSLKYKRDIEPRFQKFETKVHNTVLFCQDVFDRIGDRKLLKRDVNRVLKLRRFSCEIQYFERLGRFKEITIEYRKVV